MIYTFDRYEVDDHLFEVRLDGTPVAIQPRALDVLLYLLRRRDRVVLKSELLEHVWNRVVVTENAVTQAVAAARRTFEFIADTELIVSVRGRGYRFVRTIEERASTRESGVSAIHAAPKASSERAASPRSKQVVVADADWQHAVRSLDEGPRSATPIVIDATRAGKGGAAVFALWIDLARACLVAHPKLVRTSVGALAIRTLAAPHDSVRTLDALVDVIRLSSTLAPLVAVFEWIDVADPASILLLANANTLFEGAPVTIIASSRDGATRRLLSLLLDERERASSRGEFFEYLTRANS